MAVMTIKEVEEQGAVGPIAYRALAFLGALEQRDVDMLPPARRRQLADLCAHWAKHAEPLPVQSAPTGLLSDLRDGRGAN